MAFNFFSIVQTPNKYLSTTTATYPEARPSGGSGAIDVHGSFRWKNKGSVDEVPNILLTEYKLNTGARVSNLANILLGGVKDLSNSQSLKDAVNSIGSTVAKTTFGDPYQGLYTGDATGFHYNLPYLKSSGSIRGDGGVNEWGANKGMLDHLADMFPNLKELGNMLGSTISGLKDEGFGAEQIYKFTGSSARTITISFPLYNTYSVKEANDNFSFISLFGFQNLRTRTSYYSFLPPKVYTVDTQDEGGVYMPIAVVSSFKVDGIGALRKMSDFGQGTIGVNTSGYRLVPEAYKITITLKELIPETTNIMQGSLGQSKVQVIGSSSSVGTALAFRGTSNSSGTTGRGLDVSTNLDSNGAGSSEPDLSKIPLSSEATNEELKSRPSVSNDSGYAPDASPNPADPMNLSFVENKNDSGYTPGATVSDQDPMSLNYSPPATEVPGEESWRMSEDNTGTQYNNPPTPSEDEQRWNDFEDGILNGSEDKAILDSKFKIIEDLTQRQMNSESEDEWNQIAATIKAVEDSPLHAFNPGTPAATTSLEQITKQTVSEPETTARYIRDSFAEAIDNDIASTNSPEQKSKLITDKESLMGQPLSDFAPANGFKITQKEYNDAFNQGQDFIESDTSLRNRESTVVRPVDVPEDTPPPSLEAMKARRQELMETRTRDVLSPVDQNVVIQQDYQPAQIAPMTDLRGPVKISETSQTTVTPTTRSTVTETVTYDPVGTQRVFDKDVQEVAAAKGALRKGLAN